jgi:hypothetical protein
MAKLSSEPSESDKSNLPKLIRKIIEKSNINFNPKTMVLKRTSQKGVYQAELKTSKLLKTISLNKLLKLFKKYNMKVMNGSMFIGFTSDKVNPSSRILFKFKMLKTTGKRFRLKTGLNKG